MPNFKYLLSTPVMVSSSEVAMVEENRPELVIGQDRRKQVLPKKALSRNRLDKMVDGVEYGHGYRTQRINNTTICRSFIIE